MTVELTFQKYLWASVVCVFCSVLDCVAVCCIVLQCVYCSVLQCVAVARTELLKIQWFMAGGEEWGAGGDVLVGGRQYAGS